ncbi:MAG: S-methyl-5'-thioadenosine phosphorylase [Coriobacteriia bacterium]|nr:S-methyl-5'-thioadenosine phosphorylase [Coriobacteriia bacterium]MBN2822932.1 S-methyl-5'-thioadenosine phosphorylase [Coriobacteriia bacterium]
MTYPQAEIGVFGGSGFYSLIENPTEFKVNTPYGAPSSPVMYGEIGGRKVAFLPRHGKDHSLPPHKINYRANVYAMKQLGVSQIVGPNACGSLQADVKPGDFVICDQFVDRTTGRADTFYDGPITTHVSSADPYCPVMRQVALEKAAELGIRAHRSGTVVVIQGPRFSTRAESKWFASQGWEVINMTQYPECYLARELEICYCNISLITDHDAGAEGVEPVSNEEVIRVFGENNEKLKALLYAMIPALPIERDCVCAHALDGAAF